MFFLDFSRFNAPALNIAHDENDHDNDEMKMIKKLAQSINEDAPVYILFIALGGIIFLPLGGLLFESAIGYLWVIYL
ncbi:hypothetical protein BGP_5962 [Beggiatoa sp. PS]|nr:hypothetical protein BGP_5962 [Beggiatoa sp. PS]